MVNNVGSPEEIHLVAGTVHPIIEKVIQNQGQYPGQRIAGIPHKGAELVQYQGIHRHTDKRAQGNYKLADGANIERSNRVFQAVHLYPASMGHKKLHCNHQQRNRDDK